MKKEPALQFPGKKNFILTSFLWFYRISWPSCIKSSFLSVVIVLSLNYRPNSVQIDSDKRADELIKSLDCPRGVALFPLAEVGRPVGLCKKWAYGQSRAHQTWALAAVHLGAPAACTPLSEVGVGVDRTWPGSRVERTWGALVRLFPAPSQWVPGELSGVFIAAGNAHLVGFWVLNRHPVSGAEWDSVAQGGTGKHVLHLFC
ncbi:unnamed protein product [Rangifer tarandus platyrhynchus]|uniref:Uncharacterized protein n=2 Tax=Rangifer tarandus platyrhynchus TaxID=3082113 RepID=A0AC59ZYZ2_RANTA|nr:unnamed protein product [Rangifer tarandus platyrhynchus]